VGRFDTDLEFSAIGESWNCCNLTKFLLAHCDSAVVVKMPNTFTNEEHADMNFVYGFCNGNGMAAVVEYWQRYPHCNTTGKVRIIPREIGSFPRANAERERR
jgi:hypothetical protein